MSETDSTQSRSSWPDYRTVWRWHFYAGLFTLPFVIVLSISGAIYLFKPQIEAWIDRDYDSLQINQAASVADQVQAALAAFPGSVPSGYELPSTPRSAARVLISKKVEEPGNESSGKNVEQEDKGDKEKSDKENSDNAKSESNQERWEQLRVYVHPETLIVLYSVPERDRLMKFIFRLHGELLMGDRGSNIVELAASWTIIMVVTGLYLWWPRHLRGLGGILFPRFTRGSRIFWKDLHSVTGFWISGMVLFLLVTGLPWAKFWGNYFKTVRSLTGTAVVQQDWTTGSERPTTPRPASAESGDHAGHGGSGGRRGGGRGSEGGRWRRGGGRMPKDMAAFDRVAATVIPLGLEPPVTIVTPSRGSENWTAKSNTPNRPYRVNLVVNGTTGEIVNREDFSDRHWVDRIVGAGIAAHEGQLFGWPNQLLGLLAALGLVLLSVSGIVMWWQRRDRGVLGAPLVASSLRFTIGFFITVLLFAAYLPMFGASLLLVLVIEKLILSRIPRVRDWLGLRSQPVTITS